MKMRLILSDFEWQFSIKDKCRSLVRPALPALFLTAALALNMTANAQTPPGSLWYNGDPNGVSALANERNTAVSQAAVYDDFDVTSPLGWHVTAVFSDNFFSAMTVTGADWEIRTGVSDGNAGTLIASGMTNSPVVTNIQGTQNEFMVEVTALNIFLPMLPSGQHYWLNVTPVGNGTGRSFNLTTSGANCVGSPCGNDDNAFFNSTYFGAFFDHTYNWCDGCNDFSNGVIGTEVPEPSLVTLLTCGLAGLLVILRRQRKIHPSRTLWTFLACLTCLSSTDAQTLGNEIPVRTGFEPVVNSGRQGGRIQLVLMDNASSGGSPYYPIYWEISTDGGSTWSETGFANTSQSRIDPVATCDIWSADNPRRMYFGWFTELGLGSNDGTYFVRSLSGTSYDNGPSLIEAVGYGGPDRPWLTANSASLYLSFHGGAGTSDFGYVKRAGIPSGTNAVDWSCTSDAPNCTPQLAMSPSPTPAPSATPATDLVGNFPVAAHADSASPPNETVYMIARQYVTSGCAEAYFNLNSARIKRSTDQGVTWGSDVLIADLDGADGFVIARDQRMVTEHISRDPNTSNNYAYAFYVRNETIPSLPGKQNVLYSRATLNGGTIWNGEKMVFNPPSSPSNGFASEPTDSNCTASSSGFFRIGRVWSTVDNNGYVYVAWMDNRYGKYSDTKDYWQVFCSRSTDNGNTWSTTPIQVSGTSNVNTASIGGYGNPFATGDHLPPGDFLTCDADSNRLNVAWPDSRANQTNTSTPIEVYFRYVQF
jgi:hypothetical protein